jgi:polyvinyl alcohol dehydrogenase (cytochrome)
MRNLTAGPARLGSFLAMWLACACGAAVARAAEVPALVQSDPQPREVFLDDAYVAELRWLPADKALADYLRRPYEFPNNVMFESVCATCHGRLPSAPTVEHLRSLAPEKIYQVLTTGVMKSVVPQGLTDDDKRKLAEFLSGKPLKHPEAIDRMSHQCPAGRALAGAQEGDWASWSPDHTNARFQRHAGLTAQKIAALKPKWVFAASGASSMYSQPIVYRDRVYLGDDSAHLYALDAETGCTYWVFTAHDYSRGAPTVGQIGGKDVLFLGDVSGNGYAVDAASGKMLWITHLDDHPLARISGSPQFYEGRVYFPVASLEEVASDSQADYRCCTTRGAVVALDAATGKLLWKTYSIAVKAGPLPLARDGKQYSGPAGASVWASPTIDPKRHRLYYVTGNLFAPPDTGDADSIQALDLDSGRLLWKRQAYKNDIFAGRMIAIGPDYDFSASAMLVSAGGRDLLIAGEKSGDVWALNPDDGRVVWQHNINRRNDVAITSRSTEIIFGGTADDTSAYFGMRSGGIVALDLASGHERWMHSMQALPTSTSIAPSRQAGISAAVSTIPGVLLVGALDGSLRAFSTQDGSPMWTFDTEVSLPTVNGVHGQGGSIGNPGPVIANGTIFVTSGYVGYQGGQDGNLLIAFAAE